MTRHVPCTADVTKTSYNKDVYEPSDVSWLCPLSTQGTEKNLSITAHLVQDSFALVDALQQELPKYVLPPFCQ